MSVTLLVLLLTAAYLTYQYLPIYLQRQEVYRVLEEHGSMVAGRKALYIANANERESLRRKMETEIRRQGINDPALETWIDVGHDEFRVGAYYTHTLTWVFDIIKPQAKEVELEYIVAF